MITQDQLITLLTKYKFNEKQKNEILNKRTKTLLKKGIYKNIDNILKILLENSISKEAIENCLYVLARGKAKEIEKIFKILNENNISKDTIENCLTVLALGKAKEIKEIFKVLNRNDISKENIESNLGYCLIKNIDEVKKVFYEGSQFLKKYMQLKGFYDRVISNREINQICKDKNIDIHDFFKVFIKEEYIPIHIETLEKKGSIYLGKGIPIEKKYMESNAEVLLNIAKQVAINFYYKYKVKDISELESQAIEIILTKCGDITYNFEKNEEITRRCIYFKTFKYLKVNLRIKEFLVDFTEKEKFLKYSNGYNKKTNNNETLDLSRWNINEEQKSILESISIYIEEGASIGEATQKVANIFNMDIEEVLEEIENIKEMNSLEEVKKGERE